MKQIGLDGCKGVLIAPDVVSVPVARYSGLVRVVAVNRTPARLKGNDTGADVAPLDVVIGHGLLDVTPMFWVLRGRRDVLFEYSMRKCYHGPFSKADSRSSVDAVARIARFPRGIYNRTHVHPVGMTSREVDALLGSYRRVVKMQFSCCRLVDPHGADLASWTDELGTVRCPFIRIERIEHGSVQRG